MKPSQPFFPYLALVAGVLALSFSALFVRWANAPGPVTGFFRIGIATLIMAPFFSRHWQKEARKDSLGRLLPAGILFAILGGVMSGFDHATWNTAIFYTSVANATLLNNTAPLWVALIAWLFFHERMTSAFWAGLALTLAGALFVLGSDFLSHPTLGWGDVIALVSGLFYAGYFLMTQRGRVTLDPLSYTWIASLFSTLALLVICLVMGLPLTGYPLRTYLVFLAAAVISQTGGYLAISYALGHLPASVVSPTMIAQPVITAMLAIPLLNEGLRPAQWIGGLAVLFGIYLVHVSRSAQQSARPIAARTVGS